MMLTELYCSCVSEFNRQDLEEYYTTMEGKEDNVCKSSDVT